jgi:hypothetical protein
MGILTRHGAFVDKYIPRPSTTTTTTNYAPHTILQHSRGPPPSSPCPPFMRRVSEFKLSLPHCAVAAARDGPSQGAGSTASRANCDAPSHTISLGPVA